MPEVAQNMWTWGLAATENRSYQLKWACLLYLFGAEKGKMHTRRQERDTKWQFWTLSEIDLGLVASCFAYVVLEKCLVLRSATPLGL